MTVFMDMGTSRTRLYLCKDGRITAQTDAPFGALLSKKEGRGALFSRVRTLLLDFLAGQSAGPEQIEHVTVAGMGGSELGLCEVAHIPLPADVGVLADHAVKKVLPDVSPIPFCFIPGLKKENGGLICDMLRGEETEAVGLIPLNGPKEKIALMLPGTHNKIMRIDEDGTITDFVTTFSGELLQNLISSSILTGQVGHDFTPDEASLLRGAAFGRENGLNAALFRVRVMAKNGEKRDALSSFLYGAVLGQDLELIRRTAQGRKLLIGGQATLRHAYALLLGPDACRELPDEEASLAVCRGLMRFDKLIRARERREKTLESVTKNKWIVIIRKPDQDTFLRAIDAIYAGGARLVEVTYDRGGQMPQEETAELIHRIRLAHPDMEVGAGTVTNEEQVLRTFEADGSFIISPHCDEAVIRLTRRLGMVSIPAAYTPSEMVRAHDHGADFIKFFPSDPERSAAYAKAVMAPLCDLKLLAVGGVTSENAASCIERGFAGVGVGTGVWRKDLIRAGEFDSLTSLARAFTDALQS